MTGDDDEEIGYYSSSSNEYNGTGYKPGNEGSDSDCNRVCEFCTRPNPNLCELYICCCKECFRTNGRKHDEECDVMTPWMLRRWKIQQELRKFQQELELKLLKFAFRRWSLSLWERVDEAAPLDPAMRASVSLQTRPNFLQTFLWQPVD